MGLADGKRVNASNDIMYAHFLFTNSKLEEIERERSVSVIDVIIP